MTPKGEVDRWQYFKNGLGILLTVVLFAALVNLGLWQMERGDEKQAIETALSQRNQQPYQPLGSIINLGSELSGNAVKRGEDWFNIMGRKVSTTTVKYDDQQGQSLYLLDNQIYAGQVGYLAYQLTIVTIKSIQYGLLVELGFIVAGKDRRVLPLVQEVDLSTLTGKLYARLENPMSHDLMLEQTAPLRIQNLNTVQLSDYLDLNILPVYLQPDNLVDPLYPLPEKALPMTANKHYGYAFQWFTMAVVFLVLVVILIGKIIKGRSHSRS
ncbi:hypothetical protein BCU68_03275 [Vibrio sp. 10N.286.49.B3]|uniref:SURF1 family protein n=1 Tax=Vibrio sp. 10N.286.49.B3 TaxID=1880855 RepID=UPI000CC9CE8F|nr:SURF1 family protein [Vibrio sp. 10N.286.49.B3]PMH44536.1 hypothetical protein BCU68_03275 [Vibrio sp. 10N.286.49.B3]